MNLRISLITASTLLLLSSGAVQAHDDGQVGKVTFPTSCDAKVQAEFETGVAMLHSYWFNNAGKTFRSVLQKDPNCAMAYWSSYYRGYDSVPLNTRLSRLYQSDGADGAALFG